MGDYWNDDERDNVDKFNDKSRPETLREKADKARENLPPANELLSKGIKTESTFELERTQVPEPNSPEPTPDDPDGWETARKKAKAAHEADVSKRKEELMARLRQNRKNFNDRSRGGPELAE